MIRALIVCIAEDLVHRLRTADSFLRMLYLTAFAVGAWLFALGLRLLDDSCKTVTFDLHADAGRSLLVCYADATGAAPAGAMGVTLAVVSSFFVWFPLIDDVLPI